MGLPIRVNMDTEELSKVVTQATTGLHFLVKIDGKLYKIYHHMTDHPNGMIIFDCPEITDEIREQKQNKETITEEGERQQIRREDIQFHKYTGEYPNLCTGMVTLLVKGKKRIYSDLISSGGRIDIDNEGDTTIHLPWEINEYELEDDIKEHAEYIRDLINKNVPWGCCGGCY